MVTVVVWDGTRKEFGTRDKAVEYVKVALHDWMQTGDRLSWSRSDGTAGLPDACQVIDLAGEPTDASAVLLDSEGSDHVSP